ncbi:hypothetical protein QEN19_000416 [Hanseniaspora menglaensis]
MIKFYNPIHGFIVANTAHLGVPNEILFFAIVLLSSYFFNFLYLFIFNKLKVGSHDTRPLLKQIYIISVGLFYILGVLNSVLGLVILLINAFVVYFVCKQDYNKKGKKNENLPWYIIIGLIGFVLIAHINSTAIANGEVMTGCLMVLVIKLHEFSWNCFDLTLMNKENELNSHQKDKVITEYPTSLEFLSYVLFYNTLFTGPAFEYKIYSKWINSDNMDINIRNPALYKFGKGVFFLVSFFKISEWLPVSELLQNNYSLIKRFLFLYIVGMTFRFKYYGAWSIAESLCNMVHLGFNSQTNDFYLIKNVNVRGFEFAQNTKGALDNWNESTNIWLKNYIYLRFAKINKNSALASLVTFTVSAIWHGTHPGYYLTFVTGSAYQSAGKIIRRYIRPHFLVTNYNTFKYIYDGMCLLITQAAFGYLVMPFIVLNMKDSFTIWKSVYFIPHIVILALVAIKPFLKQSVPKTKKAAQPIKSMLKDIIEDKQQFEQHEKLNIKKIE